MWSSLLEQFQARDQPLQRFARQLENSADRGVLDTWIQYTDVGSVPQDLQALKPTRAARDSSLPCWSSIGRYATSSHLRRDKLAVRGPKRTLTT